MTSRLRRPTQAVVLLATQACLAATALASGGDFVATDLAAAAPDTYDHHVGGGAFDDGTKTFDVVEQLEGGDFTCGDHVSYLIVLGVKDQPVDANQTIQFDLNLLADSTGQSGVSHVAVSDVGVNYGPVVAGDGIGGTDSGIRDDGGSTATLISTWYEYANNGRPAPGPYTPGVNLVARVKVDDLEAGEQVVVRVDGIIGCLAYHDPTGNLQATLSNMVVLQPRPDTVNVGAQTIPFQKVDDIIGTGEPALTLSKTVTTADGACPGTETLEVEAGETVKYCYEVRNPGTDDLLATHLVDDDATPADPSDDFSVALPSSTVLAGKAIYGSALVDIDDAGTFTNTAVASGNDGASRPTSYSDSDTATVTATEPPTPPLSLAIEVKASPNADCSDDDQMEVLALPEGADAYFCYFVTNTGNATLADISIFGAQQVSGTLTLEAGASGWLVSSGTVAWDDLFESAYAQGWFGSTSVDSNVDGASVVVSSSNLALNVTASLDAICGNADDAELQTVLSGTAVYFCYTVINGGETWLSNVAVYDALASVPGSADLAPGESFTFISETAYPTTDEAHLAISAGTNNFWQLIESNIDGAAIDVVHPSLTISKTVSADGTCPGDESVQVLAGQPVLFCYLVTNTGDTMLTGISLTDDGTVLFIGDLLPGESAAQAGSASYTEDTNSEAIASATDSATGTPVVSDPDGALVDVVHPSLSTSVTISTNGTCPGAEVVNVLEGDALTWCYTVTNTGDVGIAGINVSDDVYGQAGTIGNLEPGESYTLVLSDAASLDLLVTAEAIGSDVATGSNVVSAPDAAAVNVVHPGINVDVTVSTDGTCPGADSATVTAGEAVVYCYTVSNLGDTQVLGAELFDDRFGYIGTIDVLLPGEWASFQSGWTTVDGDLTLSASVTGTDEFGYHVEDADSAVVDALWADLAVQITAPEQIALSQNGSITYTLTVTNEGEATASESTLTQTIPAGLQLTSFPAFCSLAGNVLTCDLGDLAPGETLTFEVAGTTSSSMSTLTTNVFVTTITPEDDASDNADSASTYVAPGATRTIGFYSTHPAFVQQCLNHNGGTINLGFVTLRSESSDNEIDVDKDRDVETGLELAMGILNANISKTTDKKSRTELAKARMQAGRQVLAAICNEGMLGGATAIDFEASVSILAGTNISAILVLSGQADAFNNSGDAINLGVSPGSAVARFPWDDPTDPND